MATKCLTITKGLQSTELRNHNSSSTPTLLRSKISQFRNLSTVKRAMNVCSNLITRHSFTKYTSRTSTSQRKAIHLRKTITVPIETCRTTKVMTTEALQVARSTSKSNKCKSKKTPKITTFWTSSKTAKSTRTPEQRTTRNKSELTRALKAKTSSSRSQFMTKLKTIEYISHHLTA